MKAKSTTFCYMPGVSNLIKSYSSAKMYRKLINLALKNKKQFQEKEVTFLKEQLKKVRYTINNTTFYQSDT